jgi:hypothetical protein
VRLGIGQTLDAIERERGQTITLHIFLLERTKRSGKRCAGGGAWGAAEFKARLLEQIEGKLGEHHSGERRRQSAQAKGERIIGEELQELKWSQRDLRQRPKSDGAKLKLAARLRRHTTLTIRQMAERLHLGSWKSLNNKLYLRSRGKGKPMKCKVMV